VSTASRAPPSSGDGKPDRNHAQCLCRLSSRVFLEPNFSFGYRSTRVWEKQVHLIITWNVYLFLLEINWGGKKHQ
jgi:hypothetical protein